MKKLRVSYTMLSAAENGRWDEVLDLIFKKDRQVSKEMEEGRFIHKQIEEHITKYNNFPEWFFGGNLILPETEKKVICEYNDFLDISGVFDCIDNATSTLYEYKTGKQSSSDWARTYQIPIYFYIADKLKLKIEKAFLIHFNQHENTKDWTLVYNTSTRDVENYIETWGYEIKNFLENQGLF